MASSSEHDGTQHMTLSIMALSIMTPSIMALSIMTLRNIMLLKHFGHFGNIYVFGQLDIFVILMLWSFW